MITCCQGVVVSVKTVRDGLQELEVQIEHEVRLAINYCDISGVLDVGQMVVLNTWAVDLGLGTGGYDFVVSGRVASEKQTAPGHIMKLRYTPSQFPVLSAEAQESPYHEAINGFQSLQAIPVICAGLHSQIAGAAVSAKWKSEGKAKVVYIMTDSAALPIKFSKLVSDLQRRGFIDQTITCGHSFGGDFEAVNVYSALIVAQTVCKANVIIVCQGPGNTGTDTQFGFSGIDQGTSLNAVTALGGTAIAIPRISFVDKRSRHYGLSHHSRTVLEKIVSAPVTVGMPELDSKRSAEIMADWNSSALLKRHKVVAVDVEDGTKHLVNTELALTTMGRTIDQDREFFMASVAAGILSVQK